MSIEYVKVDFCEQTNLIPTENTTHSFLIPSLKNSTLTAQTTFYFQIVKFEYELKAV